VVTVSTGGDFFEWRNEANENEYREAREVSEGERPVNIPKDGFTTNLNLFFSQSVRRRGNATVDGRALSTGRISVAALASLGKL
jgi:hypothetical protein